MHSVTQRVRERSKMLIALSPSGGRFSLLMAEESQGPSDLETQGDKNAHRP